MPSTSRPRRARPRGAAAVDTRERLLASALERFAAHGFDGTTTRAVAADADVNLGLLQYHFGGKEALWRAAVDRVFEAFWADVAAAAPRDVADRAQLAELIRVAVRFAARHPALVRLMNDEGQRDGPRLRWLVERHGRRLYELAAAALPAVRRHGLFAGVAPVHLYYAFVGAVGMIFSQAAECRRLTGTDPTRSAAMIEAHAEAVVRLFLGGDAA